MFSLKNSGDSLASEFSRLLSKQFQPLKKEAMGIQEEEPVLCDNCENPECPGCEPANDESPESFLLSPDESDDGDSVDKALDSAIDSFASSGHKLMAGLGKISSDLRGRGEAFAADMVEATALSISKDLGKEAEEKSQVIGNLNKIAKEFDNNGDTFAGDMVRVTIENIIRS